MAPAGPPGHVVAKPVDTTLNILSRLTFLSLNDPTSTLDAPPRWDDRFAPSALYRLRPEAPRQPSFEHQSLPPLWLTSIAILHLVAPVGLFTDLALSQARQLTLVTSRHCTARSHRLSPILSQNTTHKPPRRTWPCCGTGCLRTPVALMSPDSTAGRNTAPAIISRSGRRLPSTWVNGLPPVSSPGMALSPLWRRRCWHMSRQCAQCTLTLASTESFRVTSSPSAPQGAVNLRPTKKKVRLPITKVILDRVTATTVGDLTALDRRGLNSTPYSNSPTVMEPDRTGLWMDGWTACLRPYGLD
jgi:hypothetical protein